MKKILVLTIVIMFILPATICRSQISKKQAIAIVLDSIVRNNADSTNVFMEANIQTVSYYVLSPYDSIAAPFQSYWLFFLDQQPLYGWSHDCEYVFISSVNGKFSTVSKQLPPFRSASPLQQVSVPINIIAPIPNLTDQNSHLPYPTPNHSLYAVMFTGGDIPLGGQGNPSFWNAFSHMYCGLREHGFPKENIYVLSSFFILSMEKI